MMNKTDCYRIIEYFVVGLLLFAALVIFVTPMASADIPSTNVTPIMESRADVSTLYNGNTYVSPERNSERIMQGSDVYINGTYDISGVTGWENQDDGYNYIEWCGGYDCYEESIPYVLKLPIKTYKEGSASQYHYWINPDIFLNRTGWWFQYSSADSDKHGNTVAFHVVAAWYNTSMQYGNGTVMMVSNLTEGNVTVVKSEKAQILPEKPISGWLQARGEVMNITTLSPEKIWVFGRASSMYDYDTLGVNTTISGDITQSWEAGSYYMLHQYPGKNGEYDVRYYNNTIQRKSNWNGIQNIPISGIQPKLVLQKVIDAINQTDDSYSLENMVVEEPSIDIQGFIEVPMTDKYSGYQHYRMSPGMVSLFDVRGYSNANNGTEVSIVLDPEIRSPKDLSRYTFTTTAIRTFEGNQSIYQVYVPMVWDDIAVGMHTLKVYTKDGAESTKLFPISILPQDSFRPNATIKYAEGENPWKPNLTIPTPIVITKTVEVQKTIMVPVTPSQESVNAAQRIVIEGLAKLIGGIIAGVVIAFFIARFLYRSIRKRKWYKK